MTKPLWWPTVTPPRLDEMAELALIPLGTGHGSTHIRDGKGRRWQFVSVPLWGEVAALQVRVDALEALVINPPSGWSRHKLAETRAAWIETRRQEEMMYDRYINGPRTA